MPLNNRELLLAAEMVAELKGMKVTLKHSILGAGIAAMTTMAGGLLAGPIGLLIGATVGGVTAYSASKDKFKPVTQLIKDELTDSERARLARHIENAIKDLDVTDAVVLFGLISSRESQIVMLIFKGLQTFLDSDMSLQVMSA